MKLPNGHLAAISESKLLDYLLNPDHPVQALHAILFERLLRLTRENADAFRAAILLAAASADALDGKSSAFGVKYEVRFEMTGPRGTYSVLRCLADRKRDSHPEARDCICGVTQ